MSEMFLQLDFNSDEALYLQLYNQIVYGIAIQKYKEGDSLPSVRALADSIGINMHTVNKTYALLRQDGLLHLDRRRGAVIAVDMDKLDAIATMKKELDPIVSKGYCKGVSREEMYKIIDEILESYQ